MTATSRENVLHSWDSPYQTETYFKAVKSAGIDCLQANIGFEQSAFFYKNDDNGKYTAWELPRTEVAEMPNNLHLYIANQVEEYSGFKWNDSQYVTIVNIPDINGLELSHRFKRSLDKASDLRLLVPSTDSQVDAALMVFKDHPERRDGIDMNIFTNLVIALLAEGAADLHVVSADQRGQDLLGSAVVLKSDSQVNFRYYTAERSTANPGHFLHFKLLNYYLNNPSFKIIDQSGITGPHEQDQTLRGISEFKLQTSSLVVGFEKI